jgi:hypothetical protein
MFDRKAITVELEKPPHRILMVVRDDYMDGVVVFAETARLKPALDALLSKFPASYNVEKRGYAVEGFEEAALNAASCTIPGPRENPVPLSLVHWVDGALTFEDGITRAALLVELGARFVPLQAASFEEARAIHRDCGGARVPEPISMHLVDEQTSLDLMLSYTP